MNHPRLPRDVERVALAFCQGSPTPYKELVKKALDSGEWDSVLSSNPDPSTYANADDYFEDIQVVKFLSKYPTLPGGKSKEQLHQEAEQRFYVLERECFRTNQRLIPFLTNLQGNYPEEERAAISSFINLCRKNVLKLIGNGPSELPEGKFGPGATFGDRGKLTLLPDKINSRPTITLNACPVIPEWGSTLWGRAVSENGGKIEQVVGNRFTSVPKDSAKNRGICIEPSINLYYQLGLGKLIRRSLLKNTAGRLNLKTAQLVHRQVACDASISGSYATLDLSNASDTICINLVRLMFPSQWLMPLEIVRSQYTLVRDTTGTERRVLLEKFSSMGNGYTFELETVLFLAICMTCYQVAGLTPWPGNNVFAYGDDLIVKTEVAKHVLAALAFFGMTANESKTFVSGPFRESCGGDFFQGVDVRPFYLKKECNEPQDFIAMANGIRRVGVTNAYSSRRRLFTLDSWFRSLDPIPRNIRVLRGPQDFGDIVIHDDCEHWLTRWRSGIRYVRVYRPVVLNRTSWKVFDPLTILASRIYLCRSESSKFGPIPDKGIVGRNPDLGYKVGWVAYS